MFDGKNHAYRHIFLCLAAWLVFVASVAQTQVSYEEESIVYWRDGVLDWSYFRGPAQNQDTYDAHTKLLLSFTADLRGNTLVIRTYAGMDPRNSWFKKSKASNHLLKHESLHFDICELYRRKLNEHFENLQIVNLNDARHILNNIFDEVFSAYQSKQILYDDETGHSSNASAQIRWNNYIGELLELSANYDRPYVEISVSLD